MSCTPTPDTATKRTPRSMCATCEVGVVVPLWKNGSMVRPIGDAAGYPPAHYSVPPFPRHDTTDTDVCTGAALSDGTCGIWLMGGDLNGISAQELNDTVDDIMACAANDATHSKIDHNCYIKSPVENAGAFTVGQVYQIVTAGSTNFTAIGAANNNVGTVFTATGVGSGSGTAQPVVDLRLPKLFGWQGIFAMKFWHGIFGFYDRNDPSPVNGITFDEGAVFSTPAHSGFAGFTYGFNSSPPQTRFLKAAVTQADVDTFGAPNDSFIPYVDLSFLYTTSGGTGLPYDHETRSTEVGRTTGIKKYTGSSASSFDKNNASTTGAYPDSRFDYFSLTYLFPWIEKGVNDVVAYFADFKTSLWGYALNATLMPNAYYKKSSSTTFEVWSGSSNTVPGLGGVDTMMAQVVIDIAGGNFERHIFYPENGGSTGWADRWVEKVTLTNSSLTYTSDSYDDIGGTTCRTTMKIVVQLSKPYTSLDCAADFKEALAAWDLSDTALAKFRGDGKIALAPLVVYDEVGATAPTISEAVTMDDYTQPQNGDGSWPQTALKDPNDYIWESPSGGFGGVPDAAGGNILKSPMRDGSIIAHTFAGAEKHFWFNYRKFKRVCFDASGDGSGLWRYEWFNDTNGGYRPDDDLPATAMRWLHNSAAMYDGQQYTGGAAIPPASFPGAWWNYYNGLLIGGKCAIATQKWPAVNYGRSCGADKYAVDQTTVVNIVAGDAGSGFTVQRCGVAGTGGSTCIAPLAAGGLAVNDYIAVEGDGQYKIASITSIAPDADGNLQWTVTVGAKLDDLPTGFNFVQYGSDTTAGSRLGRLRWATAPGLCGRLAVTPSYAGGTVTLTADFANYRKDITSGSLQDLKIYDAGMTLLDTISGGSITRADGNVSFTHAAMPSAAFVVISGYDWTKYNANDHKNTGVLINWTFDLRAPHRTAPPAFYGGISGVTACEVSQFNYAGGNCPAVIVLAPFYDGSPVENFNRQTAFDFPAITFDEVYGAHGQTMVYLTMPDPFWQAPFKPFVGDAGTLANPDFDWTADDGSGLADGDIPVPLPPCNPLAPVPTVAMQFFAYPPQVEAATTIPYGSSLPAGMKLYFDTSHTFYPPFFPNGIPIGDKDGNYGEVETDWVFARKACANVGGRFSANYAYVQC